ncbi:putative sodium p-type atpase protein [Diplocarpon rosae]|nr:putative sodium p-type atpase protein [Diplocarpon rosae]
MTNEIEERHVSGQANKPLSQPPHALPVDAFVVELAVDAENGLTSEEAKRRLEEYGLNQLDDGPGVQPVKILIRQIANAMILILIIAMAVSFGIAAWIEGGVVSAVIVLNVVIGFIQEFNAEKTLDSLRSLSSPTASAIRNGKNETVPTAHLVPGDLVELKTGDVVPADIRLLEVMNFETDEALLTGESLPVQKDFNAVFPAETGPGDRLNIAYSSSMVTKGRAVGAVFATGMKTEIGSIATALRKSGSKKRVPKRRPDGTVKPHRRVQFWGLTTGDFIGHFLGVNVGTPLQRKLSKFALLLFGIAVVCAIIVMAANDFSNNKEGKMVVKKAWIPSQGIFSVGQSNDPIDPTDGELSHSSTTPSQLTGPEEKQPPANDTLASGVAPVELSDTLQTQILANMEALAAQGLRVLALASKEWRGVTGKNEQENREEVERDLVFQGLVGLYDPPRPESEGAVKECHQAGIAVHMLTGDHPGTARAIAGQVSILPPNIGDLSKKMVDAMVMTASHPPP